MSGARTDAPGFPPVGELLPQSGPMLLLGRVLTHDADGTRCAVDPAASALFQWEERRGRPGDGRIPQEPGSSGRIPQEPGLSGRIPNWVAVEWMAQCAGVHGALLARGSGRALPPALFVGSRRLVFACDGFAPGDALEVTARPAGASAGAVAFDCRVDRPGTDDALAAGRLLVARLADPAAAGGRRVTL